MLKELMLFLKSPVVVIPFVGAAAILGFIIIFALSHLGVV